MAVGLPAIVTRSAGVAELIPLPLRNLLLTDPESSDALEVLLRRWRRGRDEFRREALKASESARGRDWAGMSDEILTALDASPPVQFAHENPCQSFATGGHGVHR
jgi:hypothetical protein